MALEFRAERSDASPGQELFAELEALYNAQSPPPSPVR
jgi:hypothetical protein